LCAATNSATIIRKRASSSASASFILLGLNRLKQGTENFSTPKPTLFDEHCPHFSFKSCRVACVRALNQMDSQQQHQLEGHHLQNFQTEMMDHNIHNLRNIEYETRTPVAQAGAATTAMDISTEQQQQQHYHSASHQRTAATEEVPPPEETVVVVWHPLESDILSGRGAKVNLNPGNARFRAL